MLFVTGLSKNLKMKNRSKQEWKQPDQENNCVTFSNKASKILLIFNIYIGPSEVRVLLGSGVHKVARY